jgi:hypothetical protein
MVLSMMSLGVVVVVVEGGIGFGNRLAFTGETQPSTNVTNAPTAMNE